MKTIYSTRQLESCNSHSSTGVTNTRLVTCFADSKNPYLLVPGELCQYALKNKFVSPLRLYIYLKTTCKGQRKIGYGDIKTICHELHWTGKTYRSNLKKLIAENWIGRDENSGYYFIRSFSAIALRNNFISRTGIIFKKEFLLDFRAFLAGAVICKLVSHQEGKKFSEERKSWRSVPNENRIPSFYPVASKALAEVLGISLTSARGLKAIAARAGHILIKKNYTDTGYTSKQVKQYKKANPEIANRVRIRGISVCLQECDTIKRLMTLRSIQRLRIPRLLCNRKFPN